MFLYKVENIHICRVRCNSVMHKRGCHPSKQLAYSETNKNTKAFIHLMLSLNSHRIIYFWKQKGPQI